MTTPWRVALTGQPIGHGSLRGRARRLDAEGNQASHRHLTSVDLGPEIQRLDRAVDTVAHKLQLAVQEMERRSGLTREAGEVLQAHITLARDPELRGRVVSLMRSEGINASWAIDQVMEQISQEFHDAGVPYLAERQIDVRQVGRRLVSQLEQGYRPPLAQTRFESMIVVADDLGPHRALELLDQGIAAIVVQSGSPTSHLALLCRAFDCPALMGVEGALNLLADDDDLLLDLDRSLLVRNPEPADFPSVSGPRAAPPSHVLAAQTSCGTPITLLANVEVRQALDLAEAQNAQGIGLFRSEFLWRDGKEPSEFLQQETYEHLQQRMENVTVRTFDIGSDKIPGVGRHEPNPALGLRALRRYQREPAVFDRQVSCLLRSAHGGEGQLGIMLPMIDGMDSFHWAEARIEEIAGRLNRQRGRHYRLGVMIELPATLFQLPSLANAADFFCLGTNDLVQYLLAADRENPELSEAADPRHPAVLAAIQQVYHSAQSAGIDCTCCGDFAATEAGAVLLLGFGARRLSLPPAELQEMTRFLRLLKLEDTEQIAKTAVSLPTRQQLHRYLESVIPTLSSGSRGRGLERELRGIGPERLDVIVHSGGAIKKMDDDISQVE